VGDGRDFTLRPASSPRISIAVEAKLAQAPNGVVVHLETDDHREPDRPRVDLLACCVNDVLR